MLFAVSQACVIPMLAPSFCKPVVDPDPASGLLESCTNTISQLLSYRNASKVKTSAAPKCVTPDHWNIWHPKSLSGKLSDGLAQIG